MVKRTVKMGRLFSWSMNFDVDRDENILRIIVYADDREIYLAPTPATVDALKAVRDKILGFMAQDIEIEGNILEVWEKQLVDKPGYQVEEYVRIQ